jgi:hypothetical protein
MAGSVMKWTMNNTLAGFATINAMVTVKDITRHHGLILLRH